MAKTATNTAAKAFFSRKPAHPGWAMVLGLGVLISGMAALNGLALWLAQFVNIL